MGTMQVNICYKGTIQKIIHIIRIGHIKVHAIRILYIYDLRNLKKTTNHLDITKDIYVIIKKTDNEL